MAVAAGHARRMYLIKGCDAAGIWGCATLRRRQATIHPVQDSKDRSTSAPLDGTPHGQLATAGRRIYLTYQYHGAWSVMVRALTFPLRFTPLKRFLPFGPRAKIDLSAHTAGTGRTGGP